MEMSPLRRYICNKQVTDSMNVAPDIFAGSKYSACVVLCGLVAQIVVVNFH